MAVQNSVMLLVFVLFGASFCQIQYVPASILIPTFNGSLLVPSNYSVYNNTNGFNGLNGIPPTVNRTNSLPPYQFGNNYNNSYNSSAYNGTQDGHLIVGRVQAFDRLLFSQVYFKPGRWWGSREKIIEYPNDLPSGYTRHETISAIKVFNQFYDGNSARAEILKGGVGSQYVKIKLYSKWGKGFRYSVNIYGR